MAGHDDSGVAKQKSSDFMDELPTIKAENMQNNMKVIYYSRTFMSIVGGVIAGILGLTGWMGFIFYFLVMAITSGGLASKAGFSVHLYFDSWNRILLDGLFGGLMSFVLFWTSTKSARGLVMEERLLSFIHSINYLVVMMYLFGLQHPIISDGGPDCGSRHGRKPINLIRPNPTCDC